MTFKAVPNLKSPSLRGMFAKLQRNKASGACSKKSDLLVEANLADVHAVGLVKVAPQRVDDVDVVHFVALTTDTTKIITRNLTRPK